jgi:hypothetical protein
MLTQESRSPALCRLGQCGDLEASIALGGQVMGRIDEVKPVERILHETVEEFFAVLDGLAERYLSGAAVV